MTRNDCSKKDSPVCENRCGNMPQAMPVDISYKPMMSWAMNDRLTKSGLSSQLAQFEKCGYGGVLIMPWGGLPYEVMSDEWLDMIEWIVLCAKRRNMEVWLFDEWIFPSGFAGGLVGREDRQKSKRLKVAIDVLLEDGERFESTTPPRTVTAGVYSVDKASNPSSEVRSLKIGSEAAIQYTSRGRTRLVVVNWDFISGHRYTTRSQSRYRARRRDCPDIYSCEDEDAWSVDLLNRETTETYIQCIHEKYWRRLGSHFGKTIKGFFYDEPHIPSFFPWTRGFEEEFTARKGYDIRDYLVQILVKQKFGGYDIPIDSTDEKVRTARVDYHDVWTSLMAENFFGVIQDWCREHGILSVGHQGGDETLKNLLSWCGTYFKNMYYTDLPGTDVIFNEVQPGKFVDFPRFAGSSASVLGKQFAISESFGAFGHGTHLDTMRYVSEHQIIRGINKFMQQLGNYNPRKSFYYCPPDISPLVSPMIKHYGELLNKRLERLCSVMSSGAPLERICIYLPLRNFYLEEPGITAAVESLAQQLTYNQSEYDYVWENDLLEMQVRDGRITSRSGRKYTDIVIPPGSQMDAKVIRKLRSIANKGCNIIACSPGQRALNKFSRVIGADEQLMDHITPPSQPMTILPANLPVSSLTKRLGEERYVTLLLNESESEQRLDIAGREGYALYEEDLNSGELFILTDQTDHSTVQLQFSPGESRLIVQDGTGNLSASPRPRPDHSQALLLDTWTLELPDRGSIKIVNPLPSWNELGCGDYSGFMRYNTEFTWDRETSDAVLALGDVRYAATICLDGKDMGSCIFAPFMLRLSGLCRGKHILEIRVLNTPANSVCGTEERYTQLEKRGVFIGTYAPIYLPLDRQKLVSGLLGPVELIPA